MPKLITIDLQETINPDNQKFFNLLDEFKWNDLIARVKDEEPLDKLLQELINGYKQNS